MGNLEHGGLSRERIALLLLLGALSGAVLVWMGGGLSLLARVMDLDARLIGLALVVHYAAFALRIERWCQILRLLGYPYSYAALAGFLLTGWFFSSLLPARAGDFVRIGALRSGRSGPAVPVAESTASLVLERLFDILAIVPMALLFAFILFGGMLPASVGAAYAAALLLIALLGVSLLLAPGLLQKLSERLAHSNVSRLLDFVQSLLSSVRILGRRPGSAFVLLGKSLLIWLADGVLLWLVLAALESPIALAPAAFVALTVDLSAAVPITPGGVGQIEAVYVGLLALISVPSSNGPAAVLVTRTITYWSFLIISGAATLLSGTIFFTSPAQPQDSSPVVRAEGQDG